MSAAKKLPAIADVAVWTGVGRPTGGSISCTFAGARWHLNTADRKTVELGSHGYTSGARQFPVLYKNPPREIERYEPGFFDTRRLDASAAANRPLVAAMFAAADAGDLWAKSEAAVIADEAKRLAEMNARYIEVRKERAGPKLYDALRELLALEGFDPMQRDAVRSRARDLIAHVDDVSQSQEYAE